MPDDIPAEEIPNIKKCLEEQGISTTHLKPTLSARFSHRPTEMYGTLEETLPPGTGPQTTQGIEASATLENHRRFPDANVQNIIKNFSERDPSGGRTQELRSTLIITNEAPQGRDRIEKIISCFQPKAQ